MKTNTFTRIAVAAALGGALAIPAAPAFAGEKTERALIGALLGGFAGAALGKGDTGAVAVGAVAGAALGSATAKDNDHRYRTAYRTSRPVYADSRYDRNYGRQDYRRYDSRYDYGYGNRR